MYTKILKACFQGKRRKEHIHQRASQVFVGDLFAEYCCIDFGLPLKRVGVKKRGFFECKNGRFASSLSPLKHMTFERENCLKNGQICLLPFKSKLLPAVLLIILEHLFPQNCRYRYRLEVRTNSFNYHFCYRLGVCSHPFISFGSQLPSGKSFELVFQNHRYRYRLEMFLNSKGNNFESDG